MKLQIRFLLVLISFFLSMKSYSQSLLEVGAWNTFEGKIGNDNAQISLYLFNDNTVKGNYILNNGKQKTYLVGYLKANAVLLHEASNSKIIFKGNIFTDTLDKFEGVYSNNIKFSFQLSAINWGSYDHRYTDMYSSDEEVENFMKTVKFAILTGDKLWIANHMHYPIRQVFNGRFTTIIEKKQFIKHYNQIFTQKFIEKVKSDYTTNLFNKYGEAMLGSGEIWIGNSLETKKELMIIAINPVN